MALPPNLKQRYLERLDEIIRKGEDVPVRDKQEVASYNYRTRETRYRSIKVVDWPTFVEWRTACVTILDQVVPQQSAHRATIDAFRSLGNAPDKLQFGISFLKAIREDLEADRLNDVASEIEAEIASDYMGQAERLLSEGSTGQYDHVPAAVLAGAVLEKVLRTIGSQLSPPESSVGADGRPLRLNSLIDALKKRGVYNELTAKQLRAWAAIRNSAAHGNFDEFNPEQVQAMLDGISRFIGQTL